MDFNNPTNFRRQLQGHVIKSRARWIEEGENSSKYFYNLESRNLLNKTIKNIEVEGTEMVHDQSEILESVKYYYKNLFTCNDFNLVDVDLEDITYYISSKLEKQLAKGLDKDVVVSEVLTV